MRFYRRHPLATGITTLIVCVIFVFLISNVSDNAHYEHGRRIVCAATNSDFSNVLHSADDGTLSSLNIPDWSCRTLLGSEKLQFNCIAFRPGHAIAVCGTGSGELVLVDSRNGKHLLKKRYHMSPIVALSFGDGGKRFISQDSSGTVHTCNSDDLSHVSRTDLGAYSAEQCVAMSPDESKFVSASFSDDIPHLWDAISGDKLRDFNDIQTSEAYSFTKWSSHGGLIATGTWHHRIVVWDERTLTVLSEIPTQAPCVSSAVFSPDGTLIMFVDYNSLRLPVIRCWNVSRRLEVSRFALRGFRAFSIGDIMLCAASHDNRRLIGLSHNGGLMLWSHAINVEISGSE